MAITADDVEELHTYAAGVMGRADHHAGRVKGIALALLGGIIWRGEPDSIRIRRLAGSPANMLWVNIAGKTYVFAYNHETEKIEVRDPSVPGGVSHVAGFDAREIRDLMGRPVLPKLHAAMAFWDRCLKDAETAFGEASTPSHYTTR